MTRQRRRRKRAEESDEEPDVLVQAPSPRTPAEKPHTGYRYWPDEVPILSGRDVIYFGTTQDGRRDLDWWLTETFDNDHTVINYKVADEVRGELLAVVSARLGKGKSVTCLYSFLSFAASEKFPSTAWLAACWNQALAEIGYVVPKAARSDPGLGGR